MKLRIGLLLGLVALALWGRAALRPRPAQPVLHAAAPAEPPLLACRLHVGEELAFRLHALSDSLAAATPRHLDLAAVLHWRVLGARASRWLVAAALDELSLERRPEPPTAEERAAFAEPFLIEVGPDCRFTGLAFAPRSDGRVHRQLEALLRSMEIVLPVSPVRQWSVKQDDALGSYQGHYQLETSAGHGPQEAGAVVSRRRVRYFNFRLPSPGPKLGGPTAQIVDSQARATLEPGGAWLAALSSQDHLKVSLGEQLLAEVSGSVELVHIDSPPLSRLVGLASERFIFRSALQAEEGSAEPKVPDAALLALNLKGVLADFQRRLGSGASGLHDGVATLAGYLSQRPNAISELMDALHSRARNQPIEPKLHSALFLALERTGTPEAERALAAGVGDHRLSSVDRMRAAAALADVPHPSARAVQALVAQARSGDADEASSSAVLALGTLDRNTATSNPQLATEVREELAARVRAGPASAELITDIDAVGNSGDASLVQAIARYAGDPSPLVRAHTAAAFARADGAADEARLIAWLRQESDPGVRRTIVASLAERCQARRELGAVAGGGAGLSNDLQASAIALLPNEPDAQVRGLLIRLLGGVAPSVGVAKQALIAQFHRERQPELLALIGHYCSVDDLK
jgi:hypothetical protein